MDGNFVPNLTFGADLIRDIRSSFSIPFDVHLMIAKPQKYADTGFDTLLVTADVPTPARRERSNRAKLSMPPKINLDFVWQGIKNPLWTSSTLLAGLPRLKTMEKYANSKDLGKLVAFLGEKIEGSFSWDYLKEVRDRWQGKLVLKVSNHGGRQFYTPMKPMEER